MTKQATKGIVLKYMKEHLLTGERSYSAILTETIKKMMDAKIINPLPTDRQWEHLAYVHSHNHELDSLLNEVYMFFLTNGIIVPKPDLFGFGREDSWQNYEISESGKEWAAIETEPIPEDMQNYMSYLKSAIPDLDEVIIQYISETLNTFNSGYIFASAVMLGAASEKLIYLLSDALINTQIPEKLKNLIEVGTKRRSLKQLNDKTIEALDYLIEKEKIEYRIHEGCQHYLGSLFDSIRIQRNEAVHPVAGKVTQDQVRMLLLSFPHICKKSYNFLNWLKKNQIKKE